MATREETKKSNQPLIKAIVTGWIVAGTLDISAAVIQTLLYGREPMRMLQYIASGMFGADAFSGGVPFSILGLLFHYIIAMGWTVLFFVVYPKVHFLSKNIFLTAFLYGFFVWLMMNRVVLPLSQIPAAPFRIMGAVTAMLILVVAIGLPLAIVAKRYYSKPIH